MKRLFLMLVLVGAILAVSADKSPQEKYIAKYSATAVREMYRTGVPASITLAQGLLESRYGQSELASKGNNHFGIKCHDWKGKTMKVDDDRRNECFRVYGSADESFRDHSDFLRYRDRYKFLFENELTDYKAWAHGLKKAGYATDPQYASKLIKIIEDYNLSQYDRMTVGDAVALDGEEAPAPESETVTAGEKAPKQKAGKVRAKHRKHGVSRRSIQGYSGIAAFPGRAPAPDRGRPGGIPFPFEPRDVFPQRRSLPVFGRRGDLGYDCRVQPSFLA